MDEHEIVRRVRVLPDLFVSRLDESTSRGLRSMNGGGEWDELMNLLVAALIDIGAAVTPAEQEEIRELTAVAGLGRSPDRRKPLALSAHSPPARSADIARKAPRPAGQAAVWRAAVLVTGRHRLALWSQAAEPSAASLRRRSMRLSGALVVGCALGAVMAAGACGSRSERRSRC
jgi:hypothetical protein